MVLKRKFISSNASRLIINASVSWKHSFKFKNLFYFLKSGSGRNSKGSRIIRTKGPIRLKRINPVISYFRSTKILSIISGLHLVNYSKSVLSILFTSVGSVFYAPSPDNFKLFSFFYSKSTKGFLNFFFPKPTNAWLVKIPLRSKVSYLENKLMSQVPYTRSSGCFSKILSRNFYSHTVLVKLPSGVKKIFSFFTFANIGPVIFKEKKKLRSTKSGFFRSYGVKPVVRGVAMNPVDHPHGGRTKSIKYPRTPWALTTKFK